MFEARIAQGLLLKKIVDAMKELVADANFICSPAGIAMQAMDSSHVSLCALLLRPEGFDHYRCDRSLNLGVNLNNLSKILKCCGNEDSITIQAQDGADKVNFMFEDPASERVSTFELKLMDIDNEELGIPETEYTAVVKMPSGELQRIIRDLAAIGDSCKIGCTKDGVKFGVSGELGVGNIIRKSTTSAEKSEDHIVIAMEKPVELQFAMRYLLLFTRATALSPSVTLSMTPEIPLVVEYQIENLGYVRYYLAPKMSDGDE